MILTKKSIEPLSTELKSVRSNLRNSQNKDSADYNLKLIEAETARVQSQVKTLGALGDLNSIKTKILDDKQKLAAIEAAVDRTITGAYLKQKMANLLMDQNGPLCKAAKACGGKPADAVTAKDLEKLFPVSKSSSGSPASSPSAPAAIQ